MSHSRFTLPTVPARMRTGIFALLALFAVLLLAACGGMDTTSNPPGSEATSTAAATEAARGTASPSATAAEYPVTVAAANGDVTIDTRPQRIVSMSATSTEMLFAIGAGDQVTAVDSTSNYPPEAPTTDLSAYEPNVEAITAYEPDLVVVSDDIGELVSALEGVGIPVIHHTAAQTLEDTYRQIEQLGIATGHVEAAGELVADMQSDIDRIVSSVPDWEDPPAVYHELDATYYSATSATFIGQLYGLLGLDNIADAAEGAEDFPQLSAEYIIEANPDVIFLADTECCGVTAEKVAARPGWSEISAVANGNVVELDGDIASRWGPRVVEFLEVVADSVRDLPAATATP